MKTGLTTSVIMHAALLGFGLFSLSAPKAFDVADVEALPVDIVPIESMTQIQQGDKKAPLSEKPAPMPTNKPDIVPDAQKVGENTSRYREACDARGHAEARCKTAAIPKPSPEPTPKPVDKPQPEPVKQAEPKPTPVPATEVTPNAAAQAGGEAGPGRRDHHRRECRGRGGQAAGERALAGRAARSRPRRETAKTPERKEAEKARVRNRRASRSRRRRSSMPTRWPRFSTRRRLPAAGPSGRPNRRRWAARRRTTASKLSQSEDGCAARPGPALLEHSGRRGGRRRTSAFR